MIYAIPVVTTLMLGYILWATAFRLRRDRIKSERERTRGKFAFRPRERVRFLLDRAFPVTREKASWEDPLVSDLARVPVEPVPPNQSGD